MFCQMRLDILGSSAEAPFWQPRSLSRRRCRQENHCSTRRDTIARPMLSVKISRSLLSQSSAPARNCPKRSIVGSRRKFGSSRTIAPLRLSPECVFEAPGQDFLSHKNMKNITRKSVSCLNLESRYCHVNSAGHQCSVDQHSPSLIEVNLRLIARTERATLIALRFGYSVKRHTDAGPTKFPLDVSQT
jgi:hypothetical protein